MMDVTINDPVFVLGYGRGRVTSISPDNGGFMVSVPGHSPMHFNVNGCLGMSARRLVYWHDPLLVEPPRDKALWDGYKAMTAQLFAMLVGWREGGWSPDAGSDGDS